jgi:reversion-inducing-cysteine-rich protein with kazal motifs
MLFEKNGTVHEMVEVLHKNCKVNNVDVIDCVTDNVDTRTLTNSEDYIHCCRYGQSQECKDICKNNLSLQNYTEGEIIDSFIPSCGVVNLSSEFWTCFLNGKNHVKNLQNADDISRIKQIGIDSAKLHCCEKAHSTPCRRQCYNEFSGDHSSQSGNFEFDCLHNSNEMIMKRCIDEVDFPAEVGCDGLSFCSNFNNRPTELFRNCNPHADFAARNEFTMWKEQNVLSLPGFEFPINNISFCLSESWHAIACILQIKPTTVSQHFNQICWEDCFDILSKCMDWRRLENSNMEPAAICHRLSPDSKAPCISIKPYLEASDNPYRGNDLKIVSPCRGQQCNVTSEICEINRNINKPSCVQGCPMGEASNYLVPVGQYVRIPSSINKGCYKICKCMESGKIEKCQPVPCVTPKPCHMGNRTIDHGSSINIECNICTCYAEEITCTKKQCRIAGISERAFTTLPCNCPPHFVPVCARNGKTYPSACLAKCVGLQDADFEFGPCESRNPCDNHDCPQGTVCFPNRNVCLSNMSKPCPQYRCGKKIAAMEI